MYSFRQIQDVLQSSFVVSMPQEWVTHVQQLFRDTPGIPQSAHASVTFSNTYKQQASTNANANANAKQSTSSMGTSSMSRHKDFRNKRRGVSELSNAEWERELKMETAKQSKPSQSDTEIYMNSLRLLLNKLTPKTLETIKTQCSEHLAKINPNNTRQAAELIYKLLSSSRVYVATFSALFGEWLATYPWLQSYFKEQQAVWKTLYEASAITYADADDDYDLFCEINKRNEQRRAVTAFYGHLLPPQSPILQDMLMTLLQWMSDHVQQEEFRHCLDEWVEHVAILYSFMADVETPQADWILSELQSLEMNEDNLALSSKTKFKLKDIVRQ